MVARSGATRRRREGSAAHELFFGTLRLEELDRDLVVVQAGGGARPATGACATQQAAVVGDRAREIRCALLVEDARLQVRDECVQAHGEVRIGTASRVLDELDEFGVNVIHGRVAQQDGTFADGRVGSRMRSASRIASRNSDCCTGLVK